MTKQEVRSLVVQGMSDAKAERLALRQAPDVIQRAQAQRRQHYGTAARRAVLLAYAFLRGVEYAKVEPTRRALPSPQAVATVLNVETKVVSRWLEAQEPETHVAA